MSAVFKARVLTRIAGMNSKPSLELVRSATDERVLRALLEHRRMTRAELATTAGISKPTAGESVRRLVERGVVADTGERTPGGRGRGRVGSYYALTSEAGVALAVVIAPEGVVVECVDAYGDTVAHASERIGRPARSAEVAVALTKAASAMPVARVAVVSAADPVDRDSGRLVQLPDSPFLVGELDPVELLRDRVSGPVIVDNDVNWAARAEDAGPDFGYLFLGEGLGCAIVGDGEVRRGATGLAGEIAHLLTTGPDGRAMPFIEVFAELGLRRPGSTAIDPALVLAADNDTRAAVATAVAGVVAAIVTLTDPARILVGGAWGPPLLDEITEAVARSPRRVPVAAATRTGEATMAGVRRHAVDRLRDAVLTASTS